jgi:hypothetical protein
MASEFERKVAQLPQRDAPVTPSPEYFQIRAAAENLVRLRCQQLGRDYSTAEDARGAWIIETSAMMLQKVEKQTSLGAPQTQAQSPTLAGYNKVERAMMAVDELEAAEAGEAEAEAEGAAVAVPRRKAG